MPDGIVINTGPLIALAIGCGDWQVLRFLSTPILVPQAVIDELQAGPTGSPGRELLNYPLPFQIPPPVTILPYLENILDSGESSVIATALALGIPLVGIDERAGRQTARTCGLQVTGSLGLLMKAHRLGATLDLPLIADRMRSGGVWLSDQVIAAACAAARTR